MDWSEILAALGGGPGAVMLIGLGAAVIALWRRLVSTQDARISDQKEHAGQLLEITRTVDKMLDRAGGRHGS